MELDQAPTVCRYDGCALGPDGGPAPLVQPVRGGNLREYCSDRHRIAAHRARHRQLPAPGAAIQAPPEGPPSETVVRLTQLAEELGALSGDMGRALPLADADRVARTVEDARLRATEAEGRATVAGAERDRERAAAVSFREMAAGAVEEAERATARAERAETALEAAQAEVARSDAERDAAREALAAAERARAEAETALRKATAAARDAERLASELAQARAEAAEARTGAEVAAERARAADALQAAAEAHAQAQEARAEEALTARAELARALATRPEGSGRKRAKK